MKELINLELINNLKKSRLYSVIWVIISLLIYIGIMIPLFFLSSRQLQYLFLFIFAILSTVEATIVLYLVVVSIKPVHDYIKIANLALNGNKFMTKGKVLSINDKITHAQGVAVKEIRVLDLEEENKEYIFYIEQNVKDEFEVDKEYNFITYQSFLVSYEEVL